MKSAMFLVIVACLVLGRGVEPAGTTQSQSKPIKRNTLFTDGRRVPPSLTEMWKQADAVAKVAIGEDRADDAVVPGVPASIVATVYGVTVQEVLKPDSRIAAGSVAYVWRMGGKRDKGDHIEHTEEDDFPLFKRGDEYVLFLKWNELRRAFEVVGGPNGTFRLSDGLVTSPGTFAVAKHEIGRRVEDFLSKLRRLQ